MNFAKIIGVGALSLVALGGWRLLQNFRKKTKLPSKQETLLILQTIRFQFYPVLVKIADLVLKELMPRGVKPEDNQKFIMADPEIKELIQSINQKIYIKFTEEQVKQSADVILRQDGDIIKQKHAFREQYQKSLLGVRPDREMIASRKINKAKVLEVIKDILLNKIQRLSIQRLETLSQDDKRVFLESDIEQDQRVTKQKIKEYLGLYAKDSIQIFHFVVARYKGQDTSFASSYDAIIKQYQQKARAIMPL